MSARADAPISHASEDAAGASSTLFVLYLIYTLFFFLNIPNRVPGIGVIRPTLLLAVIILGLLFAEGVLFQRQDTSNTSRRLGILLFYMVLSLPFVKWPGSVVTQNLPQFVKAILFFFLTTKIINSVPRLRLFLLVFVGCQVIRVYEPLVLHLTTGYWGSSAHMGGGEFLDRLSGAPADIVNPNGLAYVIITAVAFMHYLMTSTGRFWHTIVYCAVMPPMVYALLLTGSRSGLVGFGVLALTIFVVSKKKILLIALGSLALVVAMSVLTPDQKDRYLSLVDSDAKNAATASGRLRGFGRDIENGLHRPIFGHGVGTSREANANYRGTAGYSHVMYTEVFVELGAVGLALFLAVLWSIVKNSFSARDAMAELGASPSSMPGADAALLARLARAIQAWVVMGLVFSLAQYGLSEYNWYLVGGLSVVLYNFAISVARQQPRAPVTS